MSMKSPATKLRRPAGVPSSILSQSTEKVGADCATPPSCPLNDRTTRPRSPTTMSSTSWVFAWVLGPIETHHGAAPPIAVRFGPGLS